MLKIVSIIVGVIIGLFVIAFVYFQFFFSEPKYISSTNQAIEHVQVQAKQALKLAEPYLKEHATRVYYKNKALKTHIVLYKDHYYISRANYPAKAIYYYLKPAVKVHVHTGKISFSKKEN